MSSRPTTLQMFSNEPSFHSPKGVTPSCLTVDGLSCCCFFVWFVVWRGRKRRKSKVRSRVNSFLWQHRPKPHFLKTLPNHTYTLKIEYKYLLHENRSHNKYKHCILCISRWTVIRSVFFCLKQCQQLFGTCFCIFSQDSLQRWLCEASLCIQMHD